METEISTTNEKGHARSAYKGKLPPKSQSSCYGEDHSRSRNHDSAESRATKTRETGCFGGKEGCQRTRSDIITVKELDVLPQDRIKGPLANSGY
jgi:hypothetical protein